MKKVMKKVLKRFLTDNQIRTLKLKFMKLISLKKEVDTNFSLKSYGDNNTNTFFGYYDISPFSPNSKKILYLSLTNNKKEAEIFLHDLEKDSRSLITTTNAWNWQQGSRLRWKPGSNNKIMFNDFIEGRYITRIKNLYTKDEKIINYPLYDVDSSGKNGITLDFNRLGVLRPGYGYTNTKYFEPESLEHEGIDIIDIESGKSIKKITYSMINEILGNNITDFSKYYINHLSFSPSGNKFLFFWINIKENGIHHAELWVYDLIKETLDVLERDLSVSHYDWIDDEKIIVTAYNQARECRYYIYNTNGERTDLLHDILKEDGHPTWIGNNKFITDTYPNRYGFQKILYIDIYQQKIETLLDIYSSYKIYGEKRCDLHPRINLMNYDICFDANVKGNRKLYILRGWRPENE